MTIIKNLLTQKLPGYPGTLADALLDASMGDTHAARALSAQGLSIISGGVKIDLDVNPHIGPQHKKN